MSSPRDHPPRESILPFSFLVFESVFLSPPSIFFRWGPPPVSALLAFRRIVNLPFPSPNFNVLNFFRRTAEGYALLPPPPYPPYSLCGMLENPLRSPFPPRRYAFAFSSYPRFSKMRLSRCSNHSFQFLIFFPPFSMVAFSSICSGIRVLRFIQVGLF